MNTVNIATAKEGGQGQKLLAMGESLGMRLWEESLEDFVQKPPHRSNYETVGYVIEGQAELIIGETSTALHPGDSWVVPKDVEHHYRILEDFVAVEATHPPARTENQ